MILVSGAASGLGRYLSGRFAARSFDRSKAIDAYRDVELDAVIHCAGNAQKFAADADLYAYLDDNVLLTTRLTSLRYRKFIYISSVDIYPRNGKNHAEGETIQLAEQDSAYGVTKLLSEAVVRKAASNHLILRPTGMIGNFIRRTTLVRLLTEPSPTLTLSPASMLNFVTHAAVGDFIESALSKDLRGIYNVAVDANATLGEVAELLGAKPAYGGYVYDIGLIENKAARAIVPALRQSTVDVVRAFAADFRAGLVKLA